MEDQQPSKEQKFVKNMMWMINSSDEAAAMKTATLFVLLLFTTLASAQDNPVGRQIGPDGKPLAPVAKAADPTPAPTPDPSPVPVVAVQSWTEFLTALIAALGALGALIQGLRNGGKIAAVHKTVKGQDDPGPMPPSSLAKPPEVKP